MPSVDCSKEQKQQLASNWFRLLRDRICQEFIDIELEYSGKKPNFIRKNWDYKNGSGGGEISIITGSIFEKIGINISTINGSFSEKFSTEIPGAVENNGKFWASGISIVSHMHSPLIPAAHMNTRYICTSKEWFGGGIDLTPYEKNQEDSDYFHEKLREVCGKHNPEYYVDFKKQCDDYFFLHHRNEPRGIGGIFYDYLYKDWEANFEYTKTIGNCFKEVYSNIIRKNMHKPYSEKQKEHQLIKRGRYVEFNLLYDRGTKFGIATGGNTESIMMSMPPVVKWPA